jgi:hypothetical protein
MLPSDERKGVRLEHIQQSKGFLEVVQRKAFRHPVSLERFEVFTGARVQRMCVQADQLGCDGILLVLRGRIESMLDAGMMEQRMAMRCCPLSLISLLALEFARISRLRERTSHFRGGTSAVRRPAQASAARLKDQVGQEAAFLDRAC